MRSSTEGSAEAGAELGVTSALDPDMVDLEEVAERGPVEGEATEPSLCSVMDERDNSPPKLGKLCRPWAGIKSCMRKECDLLARSRDLELAASDAWALPGCLGGDWKALLSSCRGPLLQGGESLLLRAWIGRVEGGFGLVAGAILRDGALMATEGAEAIAADDTAAAAACGTSEGLMEAEAEAEEGTGFSPAVAVSVGSRGAADVSVEAAAMEILGGPPAGGGRNEKGGED